VVEASRVALTAVREYVADNPDAFELIELVTYSAGDERVYQQAYESLIGG
jgi:hypothetical protein